MFRSRFKFRFSFRFRLRFKFRLRLRLDISQRDIYLEGRLLLLEDIVLGVILAEQRYRCVLQRLPSDNPRWISIINNIYGNMYIHMYIYMCVCVCMYIYINIDIYMTLLSLVILAEQRYRCVLQCLPSNKFSTISNNLTWYSQQTNLISSPNINITKLL